MRESVTVSVFVDWHFNWQNHITLIDDIFDCLYLILKIVVVFGWVEQFSCGCRTQCLNTEYIWQVKIGWLGWIWLIFLISFLWFQVSIYLIESSFILDILFSINRCWSFMVWYDFLSRESQGCLAIFVAIYLASLCAELT